MDLERLFHPESIAVAGASPRFGGGKLPYYQALLAAGYGGRLYPVNPAHREIGGVKVYPSLAEVPEPVDLAIVSVPARESVSTLETAVRQGVKFVHFFTAGFAEAGDRELECALLSVVRDGRTRIVGPNCIGVHCAKSRVTFDPTVLSDQPSGVAFVGQSGGVTNDFLRLAHSRGRPVSKAVSYGNQIDLRVEDYLSYFAQDPQIEVIAAYIEDIKDGRAFVRALRGLEGKKPLIVLKGGSTDEGTRAAFSHTAALAHNMEIWSGVLRQYHVIPARTVEEMMDVVQLATTPKKTRGSRVAYLGAGGGTSVLFTDLAVSGGLCLPELLPETQERIARKIPSVNTSVRNPVDLGAFGIETDIMEHTLRAADQDPGIDVLMPFLSLDFMSLFEDEKILSGMTRLAETAQELSKPVVPIVLRTRENSGRIERLRAKTMAVFTSHGIAAYPGFREAVGAVSAFVGWIRSQGRPESESLDRPGEKAESSLGQEGSRQGKAGI